MSQYIGDYQADHWMLIEKIYTDNHLTQCFTSILELEEFNDACEYIKTLVEIYKKDFDDIKHPRKSVYILEQGSFKLVLKVIKI